MKNATLNAELAERAEKSFRDTQAIVTHESMVTKAFGTAPRPERWLRAREIFADLDRRSLRALAAHALNDDRRDVATRKFFHETADFFFTRCGSAVTVSTGLSDTLLEEV